MSQVQYNTIGAAISIRIQLKDFALEDRRAIFRELLLDAETNPGQLLMTADERRVLFTLLDRYCGWEKKR